jgi:hypothetical protein
MSVFQTRAPSQAEREGQSVTPMTGPQTPPPYGWSGPGSIRHTPIPLPARTDGDRR